MGISEAVSLCVGGVCGHGYNLVSDSDFSDIILFVTEAIASSNSNNTKLSSLLRCQLFQHTLW